MSLILPAAYGKLEAGALVEVHWVGFGPKVADVGELLYAYARKKPIADEKGSITHFVLVPFRCGIRPADQPDVTRHYTNGFELYQSDQKVRMRA